ncbi:EcsC family protein [Paenibacillus sp. 2TAF8]|uniref:EcsC family protein n=1 Tax=Paenibacillus sp. 2TAF8 TaxID=3233020 RepID=UPI003F9A4238
MESRETLDGELEQILKWEKEQKDLFIWDKIGRLPFAMLDKVMPKAIKQKIGDALNEVGQYLQTGGKFLVQKKKVSKLLREEAERSGYPITTDYIYRLEQDTDTGTGTENTAQIQSVEKIPLEVLDRVADNITESRSKFAAAQGAATGFGGIVTIAADIPLVMGLSLKVLQEMALCYGYDPDDPLERVFIVKCLQFSSADIVGKKAIIDELADYDNPDKQVEVISQMQGWREVFNSYSESFGWKKLFQLIPVAGMIFGSVSNKNTIQDVAEAGKMLYKKRLILQRLK